MHVLFVGRFACQCFELTKVIVFMRNTVSSQATLLFLYSQSIAIKNFLVIKHRDSFKSLPVVDVKCHDFLGFSSSLCNNTTKEFALREKYGVTKFR